MSHSRNRAFEKRQKEAEERLKREVEEKLKPKENRPNNWFFGLVPLLTKETERAASKDSNPDTADNGAAADTNAGAEGEEDLEEEWYTGTSEECTPVKDTAGSEMEPKDLIPNAREQARMLAVSEPMHMPSLLDTTLPPCNAEIQIAYEMVNTRLRERWEEMRSTGSLQTARAPLVAVCRSVQRTLKEQQSIRFGNNKWGESKDLKPWSRNIVFYYQLRWIDYFIREAKAMVPKLLTESEILEKKEKMPVVPPELLFGKLTPEVPDYVLPKWRAWNEKKREGTPTSRLAVAERQNLAALNLRRGGADPLMAFSPNSGERTQPGATPFASPTALTSPACRPLGLTLPAASPLVSPELPASSTPTDAAPSPLTSPAIASPTPTVETPAPKTQGPASDAHFWSDGGHD